MLSIFFLKKYGLSHKVSRTVSNADLSLLDFLILDNEKIYTKKLSNSNRNKVFESITKWFEDIKIKTDIFDDVIMLSSISESVPSKVFQLGESILDLKIKMTYMEVEKNEVSITDKKILRMLQKYENTISDIEEKKIWESFVFFLREIKVPVNKLEDKELTIEIIDKLKELNLIFESEDILYLNIDNLFQKELLVNYFDIDIDSMPSLKGINKKLSLNEFLSMNFKDIELFSLRINGLTLQKIADEKGITRERVRQRLEKIKDNLPELEEIDKYSSLYQEYYIPKDIFVNVFESDERVYNLLDYLFSKGEKDISEKILNENFSQDAKEYVLNALRKVKIGTDIKVATKENALEEVMKENKDLQTYLNKDEMFYLYNEHVAKYPKLSIINQRSLINMADRAPNIIKSISNGYRYFNIEMSEDIINSLKEIITIQSPGAYNMEYIYNNNKDFMAQINILDGSELHNLYLKFKIEVPDMFLGRNPEFTVGISSKKDFIFQEMLAHNEMDVDDFVSYINENYGLLKHSFKSYIFNEFTEYIADGRIYIDSRNYSNIKNRLKEYLKDEIYLREDFEQIIKRNSTIVEISPFLIYQLGFRDRGTLIIDKKYLSSKDAVISMLLSRKIINEEDEKISKTGDFLSAKYALEKDFRIIKIGENKYLNTSSLISRGFELNRFQSFVEKVEETVNSNSYFTIKSLLGNGFNHDLIDYGFEQITLDRLLSTSDILKPVTNSYPTLYYKGDKKFVKDFLLDSLLEYGSVNVEDFTDDINDRYGLNFDEERIKHKLKEEGVFFSKDLNKVYIYKDDYLDEVYGK